MVETNELVEDYVHVAEFANSEHGMHRCAFRSLDLAKAWVDGVISVREWQEKLNGKRLEAVADDGRGRVDSIKLRGTMTGAIY